MGVKISDLYDLQSPEKIDVIPLLDDSSGTLVKTTLDNAVKCTLGSASISGIGDGTVNGAIVYLYQNSGSGTAITEMSEARYEALSEAEKMDGNLRWVKAN